MNWLQIESKWTAMTRRVRPDWPTASQGLGATSLQDAIHADDGGARPGSDPVKTDAQTLELLTE